MVKIKIYYSYLSPAINIVVAKFSIILHLIRPHDESVHLTDELPNVRTILFAAVDPRDLIATNCLQILAAIATHQLAVLEDTLRVHVEYLGEHLLAALLAKEVVDHAYAVRVHVANDVAAHLVERQVAVLVREGWSGAHRKVLEAGGARPHDVLAADGGGAPCGFQSAFRRRAKFGAGSEYLVPGAVNDFFGAALRWLQLLRVLLVLEIGGARCLVLFPVLLLVLARTVVGRVAAGAAQ